jgi:type IV secretory pathway component VirB8
MRIYAAALAFFNGIYVASNETQYSWDSNYSSFNYTIMPQLVPDVYQTYSFTMNISDSDDPKKANPA